MNQVFPRGWVIKYSAAAIVIFAFLFAVSCKKSEKKDGASTLHALYLKYKDGEIDECQYNGQIVYSASLNAYNAGKVIYDQSCVKIGTCNYGYGTVDPICDMLEGCTAIYRGNNYYSGQPFVDVYGLSK